MPHIINDPVSSMSLKGDFMTSNFIISFTANFVWNKSADSNINTSMIRL
jgi:hypothetical protein